uniref:Ectonucleoside triphosphate diphosphohydrolase 3 n=1 Tax=Pelusios castaneus TaxID=367368 RepID=A0A8C8SAP1_9SAUR
MVSGKSKEVICGYDGESRSPPGMVLHFLASYGIVLDAGSSRTTVYVYEWPAEKENDTGVVSQTFKCNVKGPGISSYGNNPEEIAKPIDDCMNKIKEKIPSHLHKNTPTYLGATAGMRLLRLQNETAANEVLESIQNYFKSQPFDFRGAQIITGQEEGVYGWITANYLMGNFLEKTLWRTWVRPHGAETTGALDLGGASTQISFVPEESVQNSNSTLLVQLYGYEYSVYTHSFQCYGRDEAEKRLLALLNSGDKSTVDNPCYPQNYETVLTMKRLYGSLCTETLRPTNYNPGQVVNFRGTGDPALCQETVSLLFNFTMCNDSGANRSFNGVYQPKLKGNFAAFSGFYYTASALNLTGHFPLADFNSSMWFLCSQNWNQVSMNLLSYCFSANYIYYLLVHGYKFNKETWPQIHFQKEVGNSSIAWSLGYMLTLTNMIPAGSQLIQLPVNPSLFAGLLFFFTAVALLLSTLFFWVLNDHKLTRLLTWPMKC